MPPEHRLEVMLSQHLVPHLQRLAELARNCGPMRLASRLKELGALGDRWTRENELLMEKRRQLM